MWRRIRYLCKLCLAYSRHTTVSRLLFAAFFLVLGGVLSLTLCTSGQIQEAQTLLSNEQKQVRFYQDEEHKPAIRADPVHLLPSNQRHNSSGYRQAKEDEGAALSHSEVNVVIVQTNTGLKRIILLDESKISMELPFTSYSAYLQVQTGPDVISVTMDKVEQRAANYALGLGINYVALALTYPQQSGDNSTAHIKHYLISLIRQTRFMSYIPSADDELCYLEQDCDLIVYPNRNCGAQALKYRTPSPFKLGYWKVKCNNCSSEQTCLWSKAEWIETGDTTVLPPLPNTLSLKTCLKDHQMFFLGDSTLRVIMFSLIEQVNTTLSSAEKSHGTLIYNNVGMATSFTFTYFPLFWTEDAPSFNSKLHDLADKFDTAEKRRKIILVIGGVQWLTMSDIIGVNTFIIRKGIPPSNVYLKLFGSGFLVQTGTLSKPSLNQQSLKKLVRRNYRLRKIASKYGFGVVDTLQMTLSRFKEFHEGACACHFHQVTEYQLDATHQFKASKIRYALQKLGLAAELPPLTAYHIDGDIHNSYTDMLTKQMCSDRTFN